MENLPAIEKLLSWQRYSDRWSLIPSAELKASAVSLCHKNGTSIVPLLLHRRRVSSDQAAGHTPAYSCMDCYCAFKPKEPRMSKWCLANDLWIGRWPRLFSEANISHQMLVALARIVSTKVVLRPEAKVLHGGCDKENGWDFLFHQDGMVGSAILSQTPTAAMSCRSSRRVKRMTPSQSALLSMPQPPRPEMSKPLHTSARLRN